MCNSFGAEGSLWSKRLATISFSQVPSPVSTRRLIRMLWLETSTLDQPETVVLMCMVNLCVRWENFLDQMIPFIVGTSNPDTLCLIDSWQNHLFPSLETIALEAFSAEEACCSDATQVFYHCSPGSEEKQAHIVQIPYECSVAHQIHRFFRTASLLISNHRKKRSHCVGASLLPFPASLVLLGFVR